MTRGIAAVTFLVAVMASAVVLRRRPVGLARRIGPYRPDGSGVQVVTSGAAWTPDRGQVWRRLVVRTPSDRLAARLRDAGRPETDIEAFRVRQYAQAGIGAAVGLAIGAVLLHATPGAALLVMTGAAVGFSRAPSRLARAAEERRTRMRLELVTIDQLLAIHIQAGAGPVQALLRVVERGQGEIVDELRSIIASIRAGRSEVEAFRHAARTTAEPHAARTYRLFAVAAEYGADLGVALRALSDDLRAVRRDELRRQATRRRAAMLVPTIAVLAPIMLLFVIAPIPSIVLGGR